MILLYFMIYKFKIFHPVPIVLTSPSLKNTNISKCNITTSNEELYYGSDASDFNINSMGLFLVVSIPDNTVLSYGSDYVSSVYNALPTHLYSFHPVYPLKH